MIYGTRKEGSAPGDGRQQANPFPLITTDEILRMPSPKWLVGEILPE